MFPEMSVWLDDDTGLVQVFSNQGAPVTQWDVTLGTTLLTAKFIAVDGNGLVYVSDGMGDTAVFNTNSTVIGSFETTNGNDGQGVAANGANWYLADESNNTVYQFGICALNGMPLVTETPTPGASGDIYALQMTTVLTAFGQRVGARALFFNNDYWLIGGSNNLGFNGNVFDDIWESSNGVSWTEAASTQVFRQSGFWGGRFRREDVGDGGQYRHGNG